MVDRVLYFTAGFRRNVVAIDAGTAETLWMYRLDEGERGEVAPRRNSGRGVSYWTDGRGDERIFVVSPGFHLVALDADTGDPIPGFGDDGIVDLKLGFDQAVELDAQPFEATQPKPFAPLTDAVARRAQPRGDRSVRQTVRTAQHDPRAQRQTLRRLRAARPFLQGSAFGVQQHQRFVVACSPHGRQRTNTIAKVQGFF